MSKTILNILITIIATFITCYFAQKWNCYHVVIIYYLIKLNVEKEIK